jgi:hypothetical protein
VSGIPEFDFGEPFDPARREVTSLRYNADDLVHAQLARLHELGGRFAVWADGFVSDGRGDPEARSTLGGFDQARLRVHRDGSIGIGLLLVTPRRLDAVRVLNAQLSYCAQLWASGGISAVDLRIELKGFGPRPRNVSSSGFPQPPDRDGAPTAQIVLQELVRVADLVSASSRHRLLRRFADRLANLYGEATQRVGFEFGPLCTPAGRSLALASPSDAEGLRKRMAARNGDHTHEGGRTWSARDHTSERFVSTRRRALRSARSVAGVSTGPTSLEKPS